MPKDKHLQWKCMAASMAKTHFCVLLYQQPWATVKGMGVSLFELGEGSSPHPRLAQKLHESHYLLPPPHGSWLLIFSLHPNCHCC